MAQQPSTQEGRYLAAFRALEKNGSAIDPAWVHVLRESAISRFKQLGFPISRRGNEEWKYTDIRPIANTIFQAVTKSELTRLEDEDVQRFTFGDHHWNLLVFVDGVYVEALSALAPMPDGVSVMNLADAMVSKAGLVEEHLSRYASYESNAFIALNTAFLHDGALVQIPDGTSLDQPIHLMFLSTSQQEDIVSYPRVLIITGRDSTATIVESYDGLSDGRYFTNSVTEVVVGAGAVVHYYKVQRQSENAYHISNTHVVHARDSSFSSVNIDLGGGLVRNNLNVLMGDEGSSCMLNGLYMITGSQHVDNEVIIDHAKPYTTSRELYKGILDGKSHSVFHGSIIVREGAKKVDANQADKNLLLSDQAEADTKPAFWIYCDDVRCAHGAACGKIDEDALFYLRSRGMEESEARGLLIQGFVTEIIDSIGNEPVRTKVNGLVRAKLEEWLG